MEKGCRQRSHYLIAENEQGAIAGLLPLSEIRSALFGNALISAGFGVDGGILADDRPVVLALADAAWAVAEKLGCPTLELRGGPVPDERWKRKEGVYAGFSRALPQGDEAILNGIKKRQRAEVRRAQTFGLEIRRGRSEANRAFHFRVYSESVRNLGTPIFPRALFEAMIEAFGEDADILGVFKDGQPLSSVLSFYFKGTVFPFWGGGTAEARDLRANELLYYELMRHASARGCTRFDFGRSKVGTGAYAFKKNWGFEPEPLIYAVRTADGSLPRDVNPTSPRYQLRIAVWKKLPLWLANRAGPPIARGLG